MINLNKFSSFCIAIIVTTFFVCCRAGKMSSISKEEIKELRFLGEYILPHNMQFKNTTVGGLSGIDCDKQNDLFYLISDDWSQTNPARFYTARILINEKGIDTIQFENVTSFLQPDSLISYMR